MASLVILMSRFIFEANFTWNSSIYVHIQYAFNFMFDFKHDIFSFSLAMSIGKVAALLLKPPRESMWEAKLIGFLEFGEDG